MEKKFILGLITGLLVFCMAEMANANLVANGSFEEATINPYDSYILLGVGDTSIDGWTVIQNSIHYIGTYWQASDGSRSIDLDGGSGQAGGIQQTFDTEPGANYLVSFDLSGNYAGDPTIKTMRVVADNQFSDFTFDITGITPTNMNYDHYTWSFIADDNYATLEFRSLNAYGNYGPVLDNVRVNAVPLPSAILLLTSGIFSIIGIKKKLYK